MPSAQFPIQIIVIAVSPVIRMGLSAMLEDNPKFKVLKSVADIDSLIDDIAQLQPDVVLLDWNSQDYESISQSQQFMSATIILVDEIEDINFATVLAARIKGILPHDSTESEIIAAVEAVASGLVVFHPDIVDNLQLQKPANSQQHETLTNREIEVLQMLTSGLSNKAVAQQLYISEHTVKFHVSSIFQKLNVSTRTEAVAVGVRLGLIML
ncbi:response regulator containing a CheY-like receiver domain and an HTH DNA-binding domain [Rivularia sp. PCC 7116]|uniref:response regulator transcription factor n=1 Tax=Rivularia sp. PCC 7116 TaxID=373994 RepID=UPI00029EFDC8|nr:response regulator transcription factor [Rivularia sp. PCC 7116]AFY56462.1 response regulator containing a CheY-like receiver domain and an HTH DNA-binding domain [Rivularia sp. PCC 7116]